MTIIIPAYNCNKTLARTLESLVQQTDFNFSVVIIDDCSTEKLDDVISLYRDKINIKIVKTSNNLGCGGARQVGMDAVGINDDYITFLDADDILLPNAVELWNENASLGYDVIFTPFLLCEASKKTVRPFRFFKYGCAAFMTHGKAFRTKFLQENNIYSDARIRYFFNDYFLCHQIFNLTDKILFLEEFVYVYIKTEGSTTMRPELKQQRMGEMKKICMDELSVLFKQKGVSSKEILYKSNEQRMIETFTKASNTQRDFYKKIII